MRARPKQCSCPRCAATHAHAHSRCIPTHLAAPLRLSLTDVELNSGSGPAGGTLPWGTAASAAPGTGLGPHNPFSAGGSLAAFAPQAYAPQGGFVAPPPYSIYGLDLTSAQPQQQQQPAIRYAVSYSYLGLLGSLRPVTNKADSGQAPCCACTCIFMRGMDRHLSVRVSSLFIRIAYTRARTCMRLPSHDRPQC